MSRADTHAGVVAFQSRRRFTLGALALTFGRSANANPGDATVLPDPEQIVAKARAALGRRTIYGIDMLPPKEAIWPLGIRADCSGFVAWCMGLPRYPAELRGAQLFTTSFYDDAAKLGDNLFVRQTPMPIAGGIVVYPYYRLEPRSKRRPGHIALITTVRSATDYDIIDCSQSSYTETGDAIREAPESARRKFSGHADALRAAASRFPALPPSDLRPPIFAMSVSRSR